MDCLVRRCAETARVYGPTSRALIAEQMVAYRDEVRILDYLLPYSDEVIAIVAPNANRLAQRYYRRVLDNVPRRDAGHMTRLFWLHYRFDTPAPDWTGLSSAVLDRLCYNIAAHLDWLLVRPDRVDRGMSIFIGLNRDNNSRPRNTLPFLRRYPVARRHEILHDYLLRYPRYGQTIVELVPQ